MMNDVTFYQLGPLSILAVGRVWSIEIGKLHLCGIGWRKGWWSVKDHD